jgi:hypothetical protein
MSKSVTISEIQKHSPDQAYLAALGNMVHWFAKVEVMLRTILGKVAGLSPDMASAILSGARADQAKGLIVRALEQAKRPHDIAELKPSLDQLGTLISVRNDLLHYGQTDSSDIGFAIHKLSYVREKDIRYPVTISDLENMAADLFMIHAHLIHFQWHGIVPDGPMLRDLDKWRTGPWHYKRSQQHVQKNKPKKPRQERTRQPRSSGE